MEANETPLPRSRYGRILRPSLKRRMASSAEEPSEPIQKRNRITSTRKGKPIRPRKSKSDSKRGSKRGSVSKRVHDPQPEPVTEQSGPTRERTWIILTRDGQPICPWMRAVRQSRSTQKCNRITLTRDGKPICPRKRVPESIPRAEPASVPIKIEGNTGNPYLIQVA